MSESIPKLRTLLYPQIVDRITEGILSGLYPPGSRIPSVRELAGELEINPNTVFRAYEILQQGGLICARRGLGLYVTDAAPDLLRAQYLKEFTECHMPRFFEQMRYLGVELSEFVRRYEAWKANCNE